MHLAIYKADLGLVSNNMIQSLYTYTLLEKTVLLASMKGLNIDNLPKFKPTIFLKEGDTLKLWRFWKNY